MGWPQKGAKNAKKKTKVKLSVPALYGGKGTTF